MPYECSTFFDPTPAFYDYMSQPWMRWRKIHDLGTGAGLVPAMLDLKGFNAAACDMHDYPNQKFAKTVVMRTEQYVKEFVNDRDVVLICRPCHAAELTLTTVKSALRYGADVFYVGLERNFLTDGLDHDQSTMSPTVITSDEKDGFVYEIVKRDVGKEGEHMLRIFGQAKDMKVYVRYKDRGQAWFLATWNGEEYRLVNSAGGFHTTTKDKLYTDFDYRYMKDHDQEDPDWAEHLIDFKPEHDIGWLSPRGDFYPCKYAAHDSLAYDMMLTTTRNLEGLGFVRAHGESGSRGQKLYSLGDYSGKRRLTPKQRRWLEKNGYEVYQG